MMISRRQWARMVALTTGLAVATGPLLVQPATARPGKGLGVYYDQEVVWAACDPGPTPPGLPEDLWKEVWAGIDCAQIVVPINYRRPADGNLSIAISRRRPPIQCIGWAFCC